MRLFNTSISNLIVISFSVLHIFSCSKQPEAVNTALSQMSEINRNKFEKVFNHYSSPEDSLKLKASYFLIENMNELGYYEGKQLRDYNILFDILANKPTDYRVNLPWYSNELEVLFDSLNNIYGHLDFRNLHFIKDVDAITAEWLINYIDDAFVSWENPWSKENVSFSDFCEYVLPYRNFNEPLESWREMFREKFQWINDSVSSDMDILDVAKILNQDSELKYSNGFGNYLVAVPPSLLLKARYGSCIDNSNFKAMIMRAYGIPVAIDYVPQYGSDHNSHYWNSIMDGNGNFVSFEEALNDINASVAYKYRISKVYRKTYSINSKVQMLIKETEGDVPAAFKSPRIIDVTSQYVAVSNVKLHLKKIPENTKYIYVGVFNDKGWTPIAFTKIVNQDLAQFMYLGRDVMYLPLYYKGGEIVPAASPFKISKKGFIQYMEPKEETTTVRLTRKYHLHQRKINWLQCLKDGSFEGANREDFSDAVQLAKVLETPGEHFIELSSINTQPFKYLRFVFSPQELSLSYDGDGASIAEIEFISPNGKILKGSPIGSPGRKYNPYTPQYCFDNDPLTFFEDARHGVGGKFVGIKLENPSPVSKIRFVARNDMNSIQPGDEYELLYWDSSSFKSLGTQISGDTIIEFNHVPKDAILWLRDLSGGVEERIFTWENEQQVWW